MNLKSVFSHSHLNPLKFMILLDIPGIPKKCTQYAIPKIKMLCNLYCLKARFRLLCNELSTASSLNLVSRQLILCFYFRKGVLTIPLKEIRLYFGNFYHDSLRAQTFKMLISSLFGETKPSPYKYPDGSCDH